MQIGRIIAAHAQPIDHGYEISSVQILVCQTHIGKLAYLPLHLRTLDLPRETQACGMQRSQHGQLPDRSAHH
ncbi:hypothetical protein D8B22_17765 [Verminephrobacter aporrectodeae subsp. tuberculatae]|nr:hypothetical protein [Verminephrobacter aporrectodeae subsp. tuberculatae]MCW8170909.1 hypothetical protein [Verminephrobacter aporrectodeae subsp. tuberculatae]MCW8208681.1 hypothetical protein [Verminephrobacter aporrectodeae subsp. tuberculatae]